MADRIALVARELNRVHSAGQARAAITAALGELDAGDRMSWYLNFLTTPDQDEAQQEISFIRGALAAELRTLGPIGDDQPVDGQSWERARRQVERAYVTVSGIEGVVEGARRADAEVIPILGDAIADAPRVVGEAAGEIVTGVGKVAGNLGAGFLGGLGVFGVLVLVVVAVFVLRGRLA